MKNLTFKSLLVIGLLLFQVPALAEDIDLFVGAPPAASDVPNVLIIMDNTANWSAPFAAEKAAIVSAVSALPQDKFRVGLMMFTETGGANTGNEGGYMRAAIRPLSSTTKPKFLALLNSIDVTADKTSGGKLGLAMVEAYRYFSRGAPYSGINKVKTDYIGNTSGTSASNAIYALTGNALSSVSATPYLSPVVPGSCAKNYIIYISNGPASDNTSDTTTATTQLSNAGGNTTTIPLKISGSQSNVADEWARFMRSSTASPVITTVTLDVDKKSTGAGPGWSELLKSMARSLDGNTKNYFDVSSSGPQIKDALDDIFSDILASNSVFASVSLPVTAGTQNTYLNQVFIGMFRPNADASPRWNGNLKQYKAGYDANGLLTTVDADGKEAINYTTGFITECARSFWTPSTVDTYWNFKWSGTCTSLNGVPTTGLEASNTPDGNIVEKGAQAYQLRSINPSTAPRTVKTCSSVFATCASTSTLTDFNNTNVSQAMLGAASTSERDALINWALGLDVAAASGIDGDENGNGTILTEMRASAHADVVHSRPVAINYGTTASPNVVVFYGTNDGILRAIYGNRTGTNAGKELWAFMPPEYYSKIKRLRENTTEIDFPGNLTTPRAPKDYGMDGPVTAFKDTTRTWIFSTMRRGGRVVYAFDVTTPASPTLKWKRGCPNAGNDTNCTNDNISGDFRDIGQTWSSPTVVKSSGFGSGLSPMLIMGGGYDPCEDADPNTCTSPKGSKIYVLNADTGVLLTTLPTDRSVVGDITIVPDSAGLAQYAYAADMGGNIYRITIGAAAPASWTLTKIASLGCPTTASCTANRKFMFAPDVVENNGIYYLMVGSGDREKPLLSYTSAASVANYFFMVKDKPTDSSWLSSENTTNGNCGSNIICLNSLFPIAQSGASPTQAQVDAKKGWNLGLSPTEQVVTSAITLYNVVNFSTHQPQQTLPGVCGKLGTTLLYKIKYTDATSANGTTDRYQAVSGGGLPPSPVAGKLILDDGTITDFCFGCDPGSPLKITPPTSSSSVIQPKSRLYWYIQK